MDSPFYYMVTLLRVVFGSLGMPLIFISFDITHVMGVLGCIWSSLTSLCMELVVAIYGLVMLLA